MRRIFDKIAIPDIRRLLSYFLYPLRAPALAPRALLNIHAMPLYKDARMHLKGRHAPGFRDPNFN